MEVRGWPAIIWPVPWGGDKQWRRCCRPDALPQPRFAGSGTTRARLADELATQAHCMGDRPWRDIDAIRRLLPFRRFCPGEPRPCVGPARRRVGLTVNRPLGSQGGRLTLMAGWGQGAERQSSYSLGYNNHLGKLNYGMRFDRERRPSGQALDTFTLTASLPLGERRRASLSSGMTWGLRAGPFECALACNGWGAWAMGVWAGCSASGRDAGGAGLDAHLLHRGSFGELNASFANRHTHHQASMGAQGALVAHPGLVHGPAAWGKLCDCPCTGCERGAASPASSDTPG